MDGHSAALPPPQPLTAEHHSPEPTPPPSRKPRRDKGQIRLGPRDFLLLTWIGEQYSVRLDTLQRLLGRYAQQKTIAPDLVTEASARRVVDRWKQEKLVAGRKILAREPEWVWLTPYGLRQMELPYKPNEPSAGTLYHRHLVNRVRLYIEARYPDFDAWRSERLLRFEYGATTKLHIPDGELVLTDAQVVAIEVERTLKTRSRIEDIIEKLNHQYEKVWYFVTPQSYEAVEAATAQARDKFSLYLLAKVP